MSVQSKVKGFFFYSFSICGFFFCCRSQYSYSHIKYRLMVISWLIIDVGTSFSIFLFFYSMLMHVHVSLCSGQIIVACDELKRCTARTEEEDTWWSEWLYLGGGWSSSGRRYLPNDTTTTTTSRCYITRTDWNWTCKSGLTAFSCPSWPAGSLAAKPLLLGSGMSNMRDCRRCRRGTCMPWFDR